MSRAGAALVLGQTGSARSAASVLLTVGVLVAVVMVLTVAVLWIRRKMLAPEDEGVSAVGVLEQLRRARDQGRISAEEYEVARARLSPGIKRAAGLKGLPSSAGAARAVSGVGPSAARPPPGAV